MLLAERLITQAQFDRAMLDQTTHGGTVGQHLVKAGAITDTELVHFLARRFPLQFWNRSRLVGLAPEVIERLPAQIAAQLRVVPLVERGDRLTVGMTDPSRSHSIEEVAYHTQLVVDPVLLSEGDMDWALERYYGLDMALDHAAELLEVAPHDLPIPDPAADMGM